MHEKLWENQLSTISFFFFLNHIHTSDAVLNFFRVPEVDAKTEDCEQENLKGRKRKAGAAGPSRRKKAKIGGQEEWNPLDATAIHPESYDLAYKLVNITLFHVFFCFTLSFLFHIFFCL